MLLRSTLCAISGTIFSPVPKFLAVKALNAGCCPMRRRLALQARRFAVSNVMRTSTLKTNDISRLFASRTGRRVFAVTKLAIGTISARDRGRLALVALVGLSLGVDVGVGPKLAQRNLTKSL